ncbi:DUF4034 domain-containing protein [Dactylosporangium sp. NPDC049742]|uniref:DUF4034 domain-containing protein n=1 Tax=Dactylosporangium sp. NPDC049742 TaxID=3154737 RepID=UPI0034342713
MWPFRRRAADRIEHLDVDPAQGDPEATRLIAAAKRGDWQAAAETLRDVEHPDDRYFYCRVLGEHAGDGAWIDEWIAAAPSKATPLTVKGLHAIDWAWQARGNGRASTVSEDAFKVFFRRLKLAEDCLDDATDLDADDPTPWVGLVTLGRARQLGLDETRRRFDEAVRRHPLHRDAHSHMLQQLCRKWSGSHELMHDFAESAAAAAPPGSPLGVLVADAHIEHWLDLPEGEDGEYMRSPEVGERLRLAADRSVRHNRYERRPGWAAGDNAFAMAFTLNGDRPAAAERFDVLGDRVTRWPWSYLATPDVAFTRARSTARARDRTA